MAVPPLPTSSPTPKPLKLILWALFVATLISYGFPNSPRLFSLSQTTLSSGYLWTLLTYPFTHLATPVLSLLLSLATDLLLLWVFGLPVLARIGTVRFLALFFGSTALCGLLAAPLFYLFSSSAILAGPTAPLLTLITAWSIFNAEAEGKLPGGLEIKPSLLFILLVGTNLFLDIVDAHWIAFIADTAAIGCGYFYCLIFERARSSITLLYPFEKKILRAMEMKPGRTPPHSKIVELRRPPDKEDRDLPK